MFAHIKHIHFVGIGGAGMSGIAEVLLSSGYRISGSDMKKTPLTERLRLSGAIIEYEHRKENIKGADVLVYSSAISPQNPEIQQAKKAGIPVIPRAEMLGELMRMKQGIAIAGTHGKTTTTSITAKILGSAGYDPTVVVGGKVKSIGTGGRLGKGEYLVCEADESDRSFLHLSPVMSVITSIDSDHLDNYKDMQDIKDTFVKFANLVPFYGCTIIAYDDENIKEIKNRIKRRVITYGIVKGAHILGEEVISGLPSKFSVRTNGDLIGRFSISLPGIHYIKDTIAAIAVGVELGIQRGILEDAVSGFEGVERRFEFIRDGDIKIVDDYAHHPKEIEETLNAARTIHKGRIIAIFQPHLYSRTKRLFREFATALELADEVILTEIYPAREKPLKGVSARLISNKMKKCSFVKDRFEIPGLIKKIVRKGDMLITLGAGNIRDVAIELNNIL